MRACGSPAHGSPTFFTVGPTPAPRTTADAPPGVSGAVSGTDLGLRIGDVAARAGVSTRTLRYYDERGLLRPSGRTLGGERRYEASDLRRSATAH